MRAKIKLAFRIVIDHNSEMVWDQYIFEDTYFEYKIQHQVFDDPENLVKNYWELLAKNPQAEKNAFFAEFGSRKLCFTIERRNQKSS
ncbi:hypothetical protein [Chryseobacterium sp. POE27]|uniref:hypothetical protein n=1 Tax=Chryseobacterium sp. POE27 TaxID=3138177 RepID=UPI00321A68D3